jgi:hypothetical protein
MAKKRTTPELNLTPELPEVVSRDFNLFFKPDPEPEIAGLKEFTRSLDNFVNDAGTKIVIGKELEQKNINVAQAQKDYIENKKKFRDAVKDGEIDETANPYYIEKYKELTLNEMANKFSDSLNKNYVDKKVLNDLRDGAFDTFYKSELDTFIKENNLGFFTPMELESGFFSETSSYRNILENRHKQNQLSKFKEDFKDKTNSRIYGILESAKDFDNDEFYDDDGSGTTRLNFLKNKLNKEIGSIFDVTGKGDEVVDNIIDGLANYVEKSDDFEYSKFLVEVLPSILKSGTNTFENIGRVKEAQETLMDLIVQAETKKLKSDGDIIKLKDEKKFLDTYTFLKENFNNENFDITKFRNDKNRTLTEIRAIDQFTKDTSFNGGNTNNPLIERDIDRLISEGKFDEAKKLAEESYYSKQITRTRYQNLLTKEIPTAENFGNDEVFTDNPLYEAVIGSLEKTIATTTKGGDKLTASFGIVYVNKELRKWYSLNKDKPKYKEDPTQLKKDFNIELDQLILAMKNSGMFTALEFSDNTSFLNVFKKLDESRN